MALLQKIKSLASEFHQEIISQRRHLHSNPELSFEEFNTSRFVAEKLKSYHIEVQEGIATTGLVGLISGKNPHKKTIALRADMDALPILEANNVPYKSKNPGVMHACGHDVHTSSLLGCARILSGQRGF
jgi:amidohydrolase